MPPGDSWEGREEKRLSHKVTCCLQMCLLMRADVKRDPRLAALLT